MGRLEPRTGCTLLLTGLALLGAGCQAPAAVEVIAADGVLCDITRRLAANDLTVGCLLGPNDDPHQVQLSPQQSRQLRQARLVLINGYGLTPALETWPGAVQVAELAVPNSPALEAPDSHGDHTDSHADHADSHDHGDRDPHVWHDPRQAAALVKAVSQRLQRLDPAAAPAIAGRAVALERSLAALDRWNRAQFATIPGSRVLASDHRAFASLARAYGIEELPVVDSASSSDRLRPNGLNQVVQQLQGRRVASLFSEQDPPSRSLQRVSRLSGVPIAPQPLRADAGGDNLMATLTSNTCQIVVQLKGRCDGGGRERLLQGWGQIP
jgi:zinc/manganese transport system substrate-binding protein